LPDPSIVTVAAVGERALVDRIRARTGPPPSWLTIGIGDDAAVLEPARGAVEVVTTDSLIEDVHFRRAWTSPGAIGAKAVAVNFSDLAAMGATPRAVLLSLALPGSFPLADFDQLVDGLIEASRADGAFLVGGNLARSPGPLVVDVTAIGFAGRRRVLRRTGGRPGDELYVTGSVGGAAAGLAMLTAGVDRHGLDDVLLACLARYERPVARVRFGRMVAARRAATAAIDLSDGLAAAVTQLAEACGTGAAIDASAIPVDAGAIAWSSRSGQDALVTALSGGEDYELLFAVPPRRRRAFLAAAGRVSRVPCTRIGGLSKDPGAFLERDGHRQPLPKGFTHYEK
jgi:thiamine-monophosphate kinase